MMATRLGHVDCVSRLLACPEVDINQQAPHLGLTALIVLVKGPLGRNAKDLIIRKLLDFNGGIDLNLRDNTGASAAIYAAMKGDMETLRILVTENADIHLPCMNGNTLLHYAVMNQHMEMTNFLLKRGANPLAEGSDNKTPLDLSHDTPLKDLIEGRYTSHTHPYRIDFIDSAICPILGPCVIGMGMCPGRQFHHNWNRDLIMDVQVLKQHNIQLVITLMRHEELTRMRLSDLTKVIKDNGMDSIHFPITDKWLPDSIDEFCEIVNQVVIFIKEGKRMLVHCNGGKGRTGLLIVGCLIKLGLNQYEATEIIRSVRPGMLRNPAQQVYLMWIDAKLRSEDQPNRRLSVLDTLGSFFWADQTVPQEPPNNQNRQSNVLPELPFSSK